MLDLTSREGQEALLRLAQQADIVVSDLDARETRRLGLDYETVERLNPTVVYCSISDFGERGPLADLPGSEPVIQAMTEYWASMGAIGRPPLRTGADIAEMNTGLIAFDGVLAAYVYRLVHGVGQRVMTSKPASLLHRRATLWAAQSNPDDWSGFHLDTYVKPPDHGYLCADRPISFNLHRGSQEAYDTLHLELELGMDEAFGDPHFDVPREVDHPTAGKLQLVAEPRQFSNPPEAPLRRPPLLGEHTEEVLGNCEG
ncbi:MAG: CoA transferase [Chloroflexi bacterium]|nr:CoA transferase [Chloroflexota bacterium]